MSKKIWIETHLWLNSLIQESSVAEEQDCWSALVDTWADIKARTETHRNEIDLKWPFMVLWKRIKS